MKLFGRIIFGFFAVLIAFNLFSCSRNSAYNNAIRIGIDQAYKDDDFGLVNEMYEYAYQTPHIDNELVSIPNGDNRLGVEQKDISFNLYVFLQLREEKAFLRKKEQVSMFTIFITDLSLEDRNTMLDVVFYKFDEETDKTEVFEHQLMSAGEENWYVQTFELDTTSITKVLITHPGPSTKEPIVLYEYNNPAKPFLAKDDHQILFVLENNLSLSENQIIKVETQAFKAKWLMTIITMIVYIGAVGLVAYAMFFKKEKQGPIVQEKMDNRKENIIVDTPKENINVKNIKEVESKDDIKNKTDNK